MNYLLGIDVGTSGLKTIVLGEDGVIAASAAEDYQFDSPVQGYAEQDPEVWWNACVHTIREAVAKCGITAEQIAGIGFSGQMHGLVALDKDYQVIRPAILHCDARSAKQVEAINKRFSPIERRTNFRNPVYTGFMLPSLLWVRDNEPENYERIAHVCLPKDYIRYRLTGVFSSEFSDASATLLFDIENNVWSERILDRMNLPRFIFPNCSEPTAITGNVCAEAAALTGLSVNTKVAAGGSDQVMMSIGNGMVHNGDATLNIGSSGQVSYQIDRPIINPALNTNMFSAYHSGRWILFGATMSAGLCLKWWRKSTGSPDYETIHQLVAAEAPGSGGLLFFPYLNGERCPHLLSDISACFLGVNASTNYGRMTRAIMEGVVYSLRQCSELCDELGLRPESYLASGGGARSDDWTQIMADVFNKPIRRVVGEEQACLGAALCAGVGVGWWQDIPEAVAQVIRYQERIFTPNPEAVAVYEDYYQLFKSSFPGFKENLRKLTTLGRGNA